MSYVLAVEPNEEQAALLREALRFRAKTKLKVVDSIEAATKAIAEEIPQLVLVTALMPPRDEMALTSRLRGLPRQVAPEVLIIPTLRRQEPEPPKAMLLGRFRRRVRESAGCDPIAFADQLLVYLGRSGRRLRGDLKRDRRVRVRTDRLKWASAAIDDVEVDLVDLSPTGAQLLASSVFSPGAAVRVHLSSDEDAVICEARVVWGGIEIVDSTDGPCYRAGIMFKDGYRSAIERFCLGEERMRIA